MRLVMAANRVTGIKTVLSRPHTDCSAADMQAAYCQQILLLLSKQLLAVRIHVRSDRLATVEGSNENSADSQPLFSSVRTLSSAVKMQVHCMPTYCITLVCAHTSTGPFRW